jgi:hypothetical protein
MIKKTNSPLTIPKRYELLELLCGSQKIQEEKALQTEKVMLWWSDRMLNSYADLLFCQHEILAI